VLTQTKTDNFWRARAYLVSEQPAPSGAKAPRAGGPSPGQSAKQEQRGAEQRGAEHRPGGKRAVLPAESTHPGLPVALV